jgi:hypothetical protein
MSFTSIGFNIKRPKKKEAAFAEKVAKNSFLSGLKIWHKVNIPLLQSVSQAVAE